MSRIVQECPGKRPDHLRCDTRGDRRAFSRTLLRLESVPGGRDYPGFALVLESIALAADAHDDRVV